MRCGEEDAENLTKAVRSAGVHARQAQRRRRSRLGSCSRLPQGSSNWHHSRSRLAHARAWQRYRAVGHCRQRPQHNQLVAAPALGHAGPPSRFPGSRNKLFAAASCL